MKNPVNTIAGSGHDKVAWDLMEGELLSAARQLGVDEFGNGPSFAAVAAIIFPSVEIPISGMWLDVFISLCLSGRWPG